MTQNGICSRRRVKFGGKRSGRKERPNFTRDGAPEPSVEFPHASIFDDARNRFESRGLETVRARLLALLDDFGRYADQTGCLGGRQRAVREGRRRRGRGTDDFAA